jgi:hypothetical protein
MRTRTKLYRRHTLECVTARVCAVICESHWYLSERSRYGFQSSCSFIGEPNISWPCSNCACPWARALQCPNTRDTWELRIHFWRNATLMYWPSAFACTIIVPTIRNHFCLKQSNRLFIYAACSWLCYYCRCAGNILQRLKSAHRSSAFNSRYIGGKLLTLCKECFV